MPEAEPFANDPIEPRALAGCGKPALIGCAVLLLAGLAALVLFFTQVDDLLAWSLERTEEAVAGRLPEDLGEVERRELDAAFHDAGEAIAEGRLEPAALQRLQGALLGVLGDEERLTRDQVRELTAALRGVADTPPPGRGDEPVEPAAEPAPAPGT